jgi:hypothetical protein
MRLRDILPELIPQAGQRWIELARSVPPYDPQQLLAYVSDVERAAEAGNAAAVTMLGLLDDMLRALVGAGANGRIIAKGLIGAAVLPLEPSHWLLLDGLPAEILRCAVNIGHNRIHLPGETAWIDVEWDSGATSWDVGLPATAVEVIKGVVVSYAAPTAAATRCQVARLHSDTAGPAPPAEPPPPRRRAPVTNSQSIRGQRDDLVYRIAAAEENVEDWPGWNGPDALQKALRAFPAEGRRLKLNTLGKTETSECWTRVKARLRAEKMSPT